MYGPAGDSVRLADTELFIRVERSSRFTVTKLNSEGKVIRDGIGKAKRWQQELRMS